MLENPQDSRTRRSASKTFKSVTCPFCSLLCDDLEIEERRGALHVASTRCPRAVAGFERPVVPAAPRINGTEVSLGKAVAAAAKVLKSSRHPLFSGLSTDVAGMRAVMALADRTGGIVDHMLGDGLYRNILAMQDRGWMTTTLAELRNRADLIVFAGTDVGSDHPRFFERYVWNKESMFDLDTTKREIVYLGRGLETGAGVSPDGRKPWHLKNDPQRLNELLAAARALLSGNPLQAETVAGVRISHVARFVKKLKAAKYAVIIWAPPRLNFPAADITVASICELVKDLNQYTRCSGLTLGGNEAIVTAGAVCTWQSGYPLRVDFGKGFPDYDPSRNATANLLANGDVDALLWISSFDPDLHPPQAAIPTIFLAPPPAKFEREYSIYIPVGTPGIDHVGQMCRVDNVVSLPLYRLRDSTLPSVGAVLQTLLKQL
ncbi:MAG TPA: formylmethanofuran dehydrogenase subunit B [Gammaproteobacteria bacterium]|nr:formylmethanofuran dehydrogenase subunit B [Gammaproteobacteria bacterium]